MVIDRSQDEYMSPFLLASMRMLIDGEVNVKERCSQSVVTISGLVTSLHKK